MKANSNTNNFTKDLHVFVFSWYMCIPWRARCPWRSKKVLALLDLEFRMVISNLVGAWNLTWVLFKSTKCS